ncbi:MAG TPA: hypothetical protein VIN04_02225 [Myxococcota bacterium]|jgi:hypothetical protein
MKRIPTLARALAVAACALVAVGAAGTARAVIVAPGYTVQEIALPDFAAGDVVVVGDALFVGVGAGFVGGLQSVVRLDASGVTVVAQGFQGLSGMTYDAAGDRLIVSDNALEAPGAVTGDTVYAIPNPLGAFPTPVAALGSELLPAGTLPGAADIELDPGDPTGGTLLVSDSVTNQVLRIALGSGAATPLQSTTGFAAGLAASADTLWFGELTFDATFTPDGTVSAVAMPGNGTATPLVSGLPGQYDLELAPDGTLVASAGDRLVRIDPLTGETTPIATGFGFATGLFVTADGSIWAIDGGFPGIAAVYRLTPVPAPGAAALLVLGAAGLARRARRSAR